MWTFWNDERFYCPKCAERENVGPDQ
jgi:hypothetical protein